MFRGVRMHHVGPAYHISPHIIVLFTYVLETLKSTWMGQKVGRNRVGLASLSSWKPF
jgi:hypothetical protein